MPEVSIAQHDVTTGVVLSNKVLTRGRVPGSEMGAPDIIQVGPSSSSRELLDTILT
jgi:hypothetical protein